MKIKHITVAQDFSPTPAGRHRLHGPYTGEIFREDILIPAIRDFDEVTVDFRGTHGIRSSFFEETFGGLIRAGIPRDRVLAIKILADDPSYIEDAKVSIAEEIHRSSKSKRSR